MIPVVTPAEMKAIDAEAPEPEYVLVERAGAAVARAARSLLGGTYGRRVLVVAGRGNNGADGRVAARRLAAWGAGVRVVGPAEPVPDRWLAESDLVIDAAYGTGWVDRGGPRPLPVGPAPVLAVDIPSGVDALTGGAGDGVAPAVATVTFAALKPGLLLPPGRERAGAVEVADIGLDCSRARAWWVTAADVAAWLPHRVVDEHKWRSACWVVAGSSGMTGAAHLAVRAAQRTGAGYVRLSSPGVADDLGRPTEAVGVALPAGAWADAVVSGSDRFGALVVGPGLGRHPADLAAVRRVLGEVGRPVLVDGDGLAALAPAAGTSEGPGVAAGRPAPTAAGPVPRVGAPPPRVLTPHDGEYRLLTGQPPGPDRLAAARRLAARLEAVVLLKGPTTLVSDPAGRVLVVGEGDARLATAGSGDVLAGMIGALLARGLPPAEAAAAAAWVHGRAARRGRRWGLVAGDLPDLVATVLDELLDARPDGDRQGPGGREPSAARGNGDPQGARRGRR